MRSEWGLVGGAAGVVFTRVLAVTLTYVGFTEFASLLPGGTLVLAGIAFGAYALTMAVAQLATGHLSDRYGRRRILLLGTLAFAAGALLCYFAQDIWSLLAGRILQGLGGVSSTALAMVGEGIAPERRTRAMAFVGVPAGFGAFLGLALGPVLASLVGFRSLFLITATLGVLASLPLLLRRHEAPSMAPPKRVWSRPVVALGVAGLAANFTLGAVFVQYATEVQPILGAWGLGAILALALLPVGPITSLLDRKGWTWQPAVAGLALLAAAAPLFRLADSLPVLLVAGAAFFLAHATLASFLPSQVSRLAGRAGGTGHGFQLVFAYAGSALGPVAGAYAASQGAYWSVFAGTAAMALAAALMLLPAPARIAVAQDT